MKILKNYSFRDDVRKKAFRKNELKRLLFKSFISNENIDKNLRYFFVEKMSRFKKTRMRNRCLLNSEGSAVFNKLRLSRISLRVLYKQRLLSGFRKR